MQHVGSHIISVAGTQNLRLAVNGQLKLTTSHIGSLGVIVLVGLANSTLLKLHLHHHQLAVITHNLALYTRFCILPFQVLFIEEAGAACLLAALLFTFLLVHITLFVTCFARLSTHSDGHQHGHCHQS